jgi:xanthine dehydrogenase/oxidase
MVNVSDIAQLKSIKVLNDGVSFGATTTVSTFQKELTSLCESRPEHETRGFKALLDNVKYFAGKQIRNVSAIAGNICTASPISDLNPVFVAVGAVLAVCSKTGGQRTIKMSEFFLGYRKTALKDTELVVSVFVPFTSKYEYCAAFKQAKRRDDDIAIVNCGLRVLLRPSSAGFLVDDACFAFGGMGPTSQTAASAMRFIVGKEWSLDLVEEIAPLILDDLPLTATSPGGQIQFRKTLAQSFFLKFVLRVSHSLAKHNPSFHIDETKVSSLEEIYRGLSFGKQVFEESSTPGVVGKQTKHVSADKQVTGEAIYVDDIPIMHKELYAAILGSSVSHGFIKSVDLSQALACPGVKGYVCSDDLNHKDPHNPNMIGPVFKDEELFATKEVHHIGQMIGIILARTEAEAKAAVKLCKVEYEILPSIFTIEEAIEQKSFFAMERKLERGEFSENKSNAVPDIPLSLAAQHVEGVARISGQEHFYLETNASLAVPGEDDEMEIIASTQNPTGNPT